MITRILIILVLILLLPAWVVDFRFFRGKGLAWKRLCVWLPGLLLIAALAATSFNESYSAAADQWKGMLMAATLLVAVPGMVYALLLLPMLFLRKKGRMTLWEKAVLAFTLAIAGLMLYGFTMGWRRSEVKHVTITMQNLPTAFDGYRIVQISDLHVGTLHGHPEVFESLVGQVNTLKPDIVCFTGDLVNYNPAELEEFQEIFSGLRAPDGVLSIMGNHDYMCYFRWPSAQDSLQAIARLQDMQRAMGWRLLLNESHVVRRGTNGDSLVFVGLENDGPPRFPAEADMPRAMRGIGHDACRVLLQHDPSYWHREALRQDVPPQLQLSGHTHAMQLSLFGWSPASWMYDEWGGTYTSPDKKSTLYVNHGYGSVMMPFRLGAWPEVTVIELKRN